MLAQVVTTLLALWLLVLDSRAYHRIMLLLLHLLIVVGVDLNLDVS